ncbi:1-acyl-sn-glycerol-3-phosphate acyltransferase [Actinomycetospora endophytica]|uniref:1-acyl-sn-glycerol-3-phosphate acyltransferase n=1 Tax=Actinomycetospora endophytica TaxID=2291215 RepID=A0ABS8P681_9PSEU|nr:1-acyl-sn-glycerol-3-phosphate acyltransferase [Actinomycetospora endophytica]MCD2193765.1 1-acyl-sn-glycerol-3-phosphate acyltransferase [Actinomycetospora endophytica]
MTRGDAFGPHSPAEDSLDERIAAAPSGPVVTAFVVVDGGLLAGSPLAPFAAPASSWGRFAAQIRSGVDGPSEVTPADVEQVVRSRQGRPVDEVAKEGRTTFRSTTASWLHPEVWRLAVGHARRGHRVVLVSAATTAEVEPIARELGADDVVCTRVSVDDGQVGGIASPVCSGGPAADAVSAWADAHDADLTSAFAYGPASERPLLDLVAHSAVVGEPDELRPALPVAPRGSVPPVEALGGTLGFYGGFTAATAVGVATGFLHGGARRRRAWTLAGSLGSELGLGLAGIDVEVVSGEEHLWSARPAVFVFNHQSLLDAIVVLSLLRRDFTGVAKAEAKSMPLFGQLFQLADVAFVERGNTAQAREALAPAVDRLQAGTSLALAPEGTRSTTPRPGRFKKGAFHMAMQAGVPMVPIVLENTGELMWRFDRSLRPGTVRVVVHPPVDTTGWRLGTMNEHVADVRGLFLETLGLAEEKAEARGE